MPTKTYTTAVVLIPPEEIWEPIQVIRRIHDRHVSRWMPHITLIYPFRPRAEFKELAGVFSLACQSLEPFQLQLTEMSAFRHRRDSFTVWLAPEPKEALARLQKLIEGVVPDCDDVSRHRDGYTPHLSVGQAQSEGEMSRLMEVFRTTWQSLTFTAGEISLIWRGEPPDDVFRRDQSVRLGAKTMSTHEPRIATRPKERHHRGEN